MFLKKPKVSKYTLEKNYLRLRRELFAASLLLVTVFLMGTLWFWLVEKWSLIDSAYMTMITLSSVGFGEINPLNDRSRLFTMVLIMMGLIAIGYLLNRITEAFLQGYFRESIRLRQKKNVIDKLSNHYILCGYGRTGNHVAREFAAEGIPFIILDLELDEIDKAQQEGYLVLQGDATLDEFLLLAKVDQAICIVAALSSDADNLYTVMSAKALNPNIRAIARASTEEAIKKLERAGADAVVSPYITGGKRLAAAALRPQVMDFVDGIFAGEEKAYYLEECLLSQENCPCIGKTLAQTQLRAKSGALVVAIRRRDGILIVGPTGDSILEVGDSLMCMGTSEQLRILNDILGPINN
ncbi:MAG: potassium channel protein [Cyanobacteria bacterium]|nr:potassium channel protein [Cyanobacteria bacterium CG_2015-16_32_12]NCO77305.1 potassium channel protein [Cyanobacteria bacterium CG_2015-22_32_23]NCQ05602.1 potassium channel protein [Cyanobacteria bacterium CG_2015-09_32_10]NCQ41412.1 potassium channel protein [Cyanobacteria bacterium CG_2015-04_32_10]NCS86144.1 potassium channel protein [Cyanobacteria bacterium CG_2015-02_32_10]